MSRTVVAIWPENNAQCSYIAQQLSELGCEVFRRPGARWTPVITPADRGEHRTPSYRRWLSIKPQPRDYRPRRTKNPDPHVRDALQDYFRRSRSSLPPWLQGNWGRGPDDPDGNGGPNAA